MAETETGPKMWELSDIEHRRSILFVAILVLAVGLRAYRLGAEALYIDETITLWFLERYSAAALITAIPARQPHVPLWYVLMDVWLSITQTTAESVYRLPSVVFSTLSVGALYAMGRLFYTARVGLLAAYIAAVAPYQILYAQWARMYSFLGLLSILSTLALYRAATRPSKRWRWAYYASALALGTTHAYGLFVVAAHVCWCGYETSRPADLPRRRIVRLAIGGVVAAAPGAVVMALKLLGPVTIAGERIGSAAQAYPTAPSTVSQFVAAPGWLVGGYHGWLLATAFGGVVIITISRAMAGYGQPAVRDRLVFVWGVVPVVVAVGLTIWVHPVFEFKHLVVVAPALYLGMAVGLAKLNSSLALAAVLVVLVVASGVGAAWLYTIPQNRPYDAAADYVGGHAASDDLVLVAGSDLGPGAHYLRATDQHVYVIPTQAALDTHTAEIAAADCVWVVTDSPKNGDDTMVLNAVRRTHSQVDQSLFRRRRVGLTGAVDVRTFARSGGCE